MKTAFTKVGGRGLGFAIACALARDGAKIAFNARRVESVDRGLAVYSASGVAAAGYVCGV